MHLGNSPIPTRNEYCSRIEILENYIIDPIEEKVVSFILHFSIIGSTRSSQETSIVSIDFEQQKFNP